MTGITPSFFEGQHVAFVTDMHKGKKMDDGVSLTPQQHNTAGLDLDWLATFCDVVGIGGDNVDWTGTTPEDAEMKSWLVNRRKVGVPYVTTTGNHDFANSVTYANRAVAAWETASGEARYQHAPDGDLSTDGVQLVAVSQASMRFNEWLTPAAAAADSRPEVKPGRGFVLTDNPSSPQSPGAALGYLRRRLATGRPTWLVSHYAMNAFIDSSYVPPETEAALADIAAEFPNLIGIMSGHFHANVFTNTLAKAYPAGGRTLAGINGPACGGALHTMPFVATVVSYRPGEVIARWRDLTSRRWIRHDTYGWFRKVAVSCTAPIKERV